MNGRQNKPLLVEAAHSHLPGEILAQPKRGFELPWEKWLKGALRCEVEETLAESGPALGAVFQWSKVRVVWNDFVGGREHWSRPWLFYVLRKWTERHLTA
jgi:asparagine synthase (glutamine-hydrolysing)